MAELTTKVDELVTKVDQQRTVIESVTTLVQGLRDQIVAAQGELDSAGEAAAAARLGDIVASIDANTQRLAEAVASGTDAEGETPVR